MKLSRMMVWLVAVGFSGFSAQAELRVAAIFGDNMVLQQQMTVPVWGWAAPDANVTVKFADQTKTTYADANGKWLVKLGKLKATFDVQTLTVESGETKVFTNILVGEVWLASGQSNMEKPIGKQPGQKPTLNAEAELAAAEYPNIRIFKVDKKLAATPLAGLGKNSGWLPCSSNSLDGISFSAAAYFFGREIYTNLNVPVGLVESSWGGTRIEPWTPPAGFEQVASQKKFAATSVDLSKKTAYTEPTAIYNAMIAPIAGFAMRGALWYQGESNLMGTNDDNDYREYADKMQALVGGWRALWGEGDFAFYFVQIAPFGYAGPKWHFANSPEMLPEFWTLQSRAARTIPHAGMVVTTDLVNDLNDIHPRDKKDVGHRLALLALDKTYDKKVASEGPVFEKAKFKDGKAILEFKHDDGLKSRDGHPLTWFTIAGADGKFVPAEADIVGETVEVSSKEVSNPVAVRFAWNENAQPNLCNGAGLPTEPFRTDEN
ncbi:MAG TPA: sialate O-acetylesterase [Candidatus Sulfotelmatobacter sp.]|nr:sialate O-acetylesterase [Candidatus Sulfotelmatobacter sp.]